MQRMYYTKPWCLVLVILFRVYQPQYSDTGSLDISRKITWFFFADVSNSQPRHISVATPSSGHFYEVFLWSFYEMFDQSAHLKPSTVTGNRCLVEQTFGSSLSYSSLLLTEICIQDFISRTDKVLKFDSLAVITLAAYSTDLSKVIIQCYFEKNSIKFLQVLVWKPKENLKNFEFSSEFLPLVLFWSDITGWFNLILCVTGNNGKWLSAGLYNMDGSGTVRRQGTFKL